VSRQHACASRSERKGFPNRRAPESAIDHFVKESKKVGEIDPKSAIETTSIEPPIHERIVPLHHHEAFALETIHRSRSQKGCYLMRFITKARHPARNLRRKSSW
jgi:hypothetical protein